jgi:hypothetical protein
MPERVSRRWSQMLLYFLVTVAVVAAPILGVVAVPKFNPLISAFPDDVRNVATVLMTVAFSAVAVLVRFLALGKMKNALRQRLGVGCIAGVLVLVVVIAAHLSFWVVDVEFNGGDDSVSFVVGGDGRLPSCKCDPVESDALCIKGLSLDEANVASCWGDRAIKTTRFLLLLEYLGTLFFFSLAIGFLVLMESPATRTGSPPSS